MSKSYRIDLLDNGKYELTLVDGPKTTGITNQEGYEHTLKDIFKIIEKKEERKTSTLLEQTSTLLELLSNRLNALFWATDSSEVSHEVHVINKEVSKILLIIKGKDNE